MLHRIRQASMWFLATIWSLFMSGLIAILPVILTIVIFNFLFKFATKWLEPIHTLNLPLINSIPHFEIIVVFVSILIFGAILQVFVLRSILQHIESFIIRLPLVRPVYTGIKQLVAAFSSQDKVTFKHVVMIEFPHQHIYSIGFLTAEMPEVLAPNKNSKYYNVFVPTTPNPTTGFFVIVPEDKITITELTRQEAMTLIMSGGIICPTRFTIYK